VKCGINLLHEEARMTPEDGRGILYVPMVFKPDSLGVEASGFTTKAPRHKGSWKQPEIGFFGSKMAMREELNPKKSRRFLRAGM